MEYEQIFIVLALLNWFIQGYSEDMRNAIKSKHDLTGSSYTDAAYREVFDRCVHDKPLVEADSSKNRIDLLKKKLKTKGKFYKHIAVVTHGSFINLLL